MRLSTHIALVIALSFSGLALAQPGGIKETQKKDAGMQHCMGMQNTDMQKCQEMMNMQGMKGMDMGQPAQGTPSKAMTHQASAVVKAADPAKGTVTLAHGPVKTLNWPAMTMGFKVKDKMLFDKLATDKKVVVDFVQQGSDYVITAVR
jgi:Cu(I)/Ag(I) efflux system protein CusF